MTVNPWIMAPSGPDPLTASLQGEKERTIALLGEHFAQDNLSLDELERRIERAYRAPDLASLKDLLKDLPSAETAIASRSQAAVASPEIYPLEEGRIVSIMSSTKRRGLWQPPRFLDLWAIMSETILDMTRAVLQPGVTELEVRGLMTTVKIIVPPGVRVVTQASGFMAEVSDLTIDPPPVGSGAPVIRITGWVVMGELKVVVRRSELAEDIE
ncbi:MAG TPA: DUF1707 domain-containing protein [Gemmatimonadaceae bacterium]|nr:DUF1707 domain-containing protein [Gemmatimonadaceae bacterium]